MPTYYVNFDPYLNYFPTHLTHNYCSIVPRLKRASRTVSLLLANDSGRKDLKPDSETSPRFRLAYEESTAGRSSNECTASHAQHG